MTFWEETKDQFIKDRTLYTFHDWAYYVYLDTLVFCHEGVLIDSVPRGGNDTLTASRWLNKRLKQEVSAAVKLQEEFEQAFFEWVQDGEET